MLSPSLWLCFVCVIGLVLGSHIHVAIAQCLKEQLEGCSKLIHWSVENLINFAQIHHFSEGNMKSLKHEMTTALYLSITGAAGRGHGSIHGPTLVLNSEENLHHLPLSTKYHLVTELW